MIEAIVTASEEERARPWFSQCMESLAASPRLTVRLRPQAGTTGESRAKELIESDADLLCFVDPDDYVDPGVFDQIADAMEDRSVTVCATWEAEVNSDGGLISVNRWTARSAGVSTILHHMCVFRRENILSAAAKAASCPRNAFEQRPFILEAMKHGRLEVIERVGYYWRIHDSQNHKRSE